jgi:hypothetical protein
MKKSTEHPHRRFGIASKAMLEAERSQLGNGTARAGIIVHARRTDWRDRLGRLKRDAQAALYYG